MKQFLLGLALLLLSASQVLSQRVVTGKVSDDQGEPLIGATITAPGTSSGTTTDVSGMFRFSVSSGSTVLKVSYTGYLTQDVPLTSASDYTIVMQVNPNTLQEVVVVGYGTQQKRAITGSISSIKGDDIAQLPAQSFDQLLQGRAAGVNVSMPNGVLNNPPVFRVRGINSINLSSFPLVVIDGVPTYTGSFGNSAANNPLSNLNPADIESIDILKDASATAIYGSRASAGVVLITTKRGAKGKTQVNYNVWTGWTQAVRVPEVLNAQQYVEVKNEAAANANLSGPQYFLDTINGRQVDTRWADYIYRNAFQQNHALSFSGGGDQTTYYMAMGYTRQEGMIVANEFERLSGRLNLDHKLTDRIKLGGTIGYAKNNNAAPNTGSLPGEAFATSGIGRLAFVLSPVVDPYRYDANGNRLEGNAQYNITSTNALGLGKNKQSTGFVNPIPIIDLNRYTSEANQIQASVYGELEVVKDLKVKTIYGIDNLSVENLQYWSPLHGDGFGQNGLAANSYIRNNRWNWQNLVTYDLNLQDKHKIGLLAGNEQQYTVAEGWGASRTAVADPFFSTYQGNFTTINPTGNFQGENYLLSYFGRATYEFNRRYYLTANIRQDEYSAYAPGNKKGTFWGVSAGWNLSEEDFWKNSIGNTVNFFKLRGSYGTVGNANGIGDFASLDLYGSGLYAAAPTFFYSQAGNPLLSWESSTKLDVGIVFGLFNDRLQGEYTYFSNVIDGLILPAPQSPSKGIPNNSINVNVGSMENTGHEFGLSATVLRKGKFSWTTSANITLMKNEVTELAEGNADILAQTSGLETTSIIRVGESIGSIYAVETQGVNPANGQRIYVKYEYDGDGNRIGSYQVQYNHAAPAGQRWTRVDNGAIVSAPSQISDGNVYGPTLPKWFGGWDNTFTYGAFDLNIQMNYAGGNYIYNGSKAGLRDQRFWNNHVDILDRWSENNTDGKLPRVVFGDNVSNGSALAISENVEKGDFLRVRNITLGYRLPSSVLEKAKIANLRVYGSVNNALLFTNYSGTDPEVSTNGNSNSAPGVDRNTVPMARTFVVGLNLGF
ncbi:MAG: TonB-dependent receptor [Saprospiraceae bacterium]|nr:TonB-dependent receptor [Saprospiraceae bacterium]